MATYIQVMLPVTAAERVLHFAVNGIALRMDFGPQIGIYGSIPGTGVTISCSFFSETIWQFPYFIPEHYDAQKFAQGKLKVSSDNLASVLFERGTASRYDNQSEIPAGGTFTLALDKVVSITPFPQHLPDAALPLKLINE